MESGTVIIVFVLLLLAWSCFSREGLVSGQVRYSPRDLINNVGCNKLLPRITNGFYNTYDVQCCDDMAVGNTIEPVNPMDVYSNRAIDNMYGYMFRTRSDDVTSRVYKNPKAAARAYCSNHNRVVTGLVSAS